ncbi:hypothetical protein UY3_09175 [Chelonia mydas]|uniref:Uncharacterized protein n=1 Tax=Chelonia mydas TaxID=8469 RepID=M7B918_CHEMY|nr:hypothetical protein UY3_09175 [Chelonia mydas]
MPPPQLPLAGNHDWVGSCRGGVYGQGSVQSSLATPPCRSQRGDMLLLETISLQKALATPQPHWPCRKKKHLADFLTPESSRPWLLYLPLLPLYLHEREALYHIDHNVTTGILHVSKSVAISEDTSSCGVSGVQFLVPGDNWKFIVAY